MKITNTPPILCLCYTADQESFYINAAPAATSSLLSLTEKSLKIHSFWCKWHCMIPTVGFALSVFTFLLFYIAWTAPNLFIAHTCDRQLRLFL